MNYGTKEIVFIHNSNKLNVNFIFHHTSELVFNKLFARLSIKIPSK